MVPTSCTVKLLRRRLVHVLLKCSTQLLSWASSTQRVSCSKRAPEVYVAAVLSFKKVCTQWNIICSSWMENKVSRSKEMIPISAAVNSENPSMIKAAKWSFSPFHPLSLTTRQSTFAQYTNCLAPLLEVYFLGRLTTYLLYVYLVRPV